MNIGAMTFRNSFVNDYALVTLKGIETLLDFRIIEFDRLYSDGHYVLHLEFNLDLHMDSSNIRRTKLYTYQLLMAIKTHL